MPLLPFGRKKAGEAHTPTATDRPEAAGESEGPVNILRYLRPECIRLELETRPAPVPEEETEAQRERRLIADKEAVLQELTDLFDVSGEITNPTKFYKDLVHRERKATTGIAPGIAIPHVRTMQARSFVIGFARSTPGVPFASLDGTDTHLFFLLAAPPYEDKLYLKVYREFAEMVSNEWVLDAFMDAATEQDVLNVLRGFVHQ